MTKKYQQSQGLLGLYAAKQFQIQESLTLYPYYYHEFTVRNGVALIGEVSMTNDDNTDNRFYEPIGRFPSIEEDEPAYRLLCTEYPEVK